MKPTLLEMYKWTLALKEYRKKKIDHSLLIGLFKCIFCVDAQLIIHGFDYCMECKLDKRGKQICREQYRDNTLDIDYNVQIEYLKEKIQQLEKGDEEQVKVLADPFGEMNKDILGIEKEERAK